MSLMNKNYATLTATRAVQAILERGAERLYDRYLQQKLPVHAHGLNQDQFQTNLKALSMKAGSRPQMEVVATRIVQNIPPDNFAAKRIAIKRSSMPSTFSPQKESTIDKSTKYQTVIQSQRTIHEQQNTSKEIEDSMLLQEESKQSPMFARTERPSTMQVGRAQARDDQAIGQERIVEEKRAATCHVRKRKSIAVQQSEAKKFVKLHEEVPILLKEEVQAFTRLRQERDERMQEEDLIERHHAQEAARLRMKEVRQREHFEALQKRAKGKGKFNIPLTNFQNESGEIFINGRPKVPQTHIIQLQFNPEEEQLQSTIESKHSSVHPTKTKSFFSTKLKKKIKISDEQFTNNGSRQTSSIPFVTLSYGIVISQDGLDATASRRRPQNELTRSKYAEQSPSKFKSHIPIVNSARINIFSTIEAEPTARSAVMEHPQLSNSLQKNMETTIESKMDMQRSLLWNPRGKSEGKGIRVSNRELLQREVLESKLAVAH